MAQEICTLLTRPSIFHPLQTLVASPALFALRPSRPSSAWPLLLFMSVVMGSSGHSLSQKFSLHEQWCCHCVLQLLSPSRGSSALWPLIICNQQQLWPSGRRRVNVGCIPLMSSLLHCYGLPSSLFSRHSSCQAGLSIKLLSLAFCNHSLLLML